MEEELAQSRNRFAPQARTIGSTMLASMVKVHAFGWHMMVLCCLTVLVLMPTFALGRPYIDKAAQQKLMAQIRSMPDEELLKKLQNPEERYLYLIVDETGRRRFLAAKDALKKLESKALEILQADAKKGVMLVPHPDKVVRVLPRVKMALLRLKFEEEGIPKGRKTFEKCLELYRKDSTVREHVDLTHLIFEENKEELSNLVLKLLSSEDPKNVLVIALFLNLAKKIPGPDKNKIIKSIIDDKRHEKGIRLTALTAYDYSCDKNGLDMVGKRLQSDDSYTSECAFYISKKVVDRSKYKKWVKQYLPKVPHEKVRKLIEEYINPYKQTKKRESEKKDSNGGCSLDATDRSPDSLSNLLGCLLPVLLIACACLVLRRRSAGRAGA